MKRWPYRSNVIEAFLWPSIRCIALMLAPVEMARLQRYAAGRGIEVPSGPGSGRRVRTESVREGSMSPAVGNSVASLSRALVTALESADSATRLRELEAMIDRLLAGDSDAPGLRAVG